MLSIIPNYEPDPMLTLCEGQLLLDVVFELPDGDFDNNVHIALRETLPPNLKMFTADQIGFGLTSAEARALAALLLATAEQNDDWLKGKANR